MAYREPTNEELHELLDSASGMLGRLTPKDQEQFRSAIRKIKIVVDNNKYGTKDPWIV